MLHKKKVEQPKLEGKTARNIPHLEACRNAYTDLAGMMFKLKDVYIC